ncbi:MULTISPECIES: sensor histidine kinase [unclassified Mesorhizobium]|uniref:sensor histidine kinase n=1 Tax=unclassified Mesorhizobium TaxID=325217 RepID=UPI000F760E7F|nr:MULTISPECIES: sensor histidine kinase [unclassified Mesorhizobium]TGR37221.1 HAMP domain-containing protein [bacterium M00.F.Ca.ET.199.01.1.1]TGU22016.1 HAMP domain-containing protein [bacterium M00.F.Ca.ET.156.01.1.1]TGU94674.1 HAMP domain-containing protein [Mesorhizobium sp. M00.F.Ca.ET.151.01.1.1]TGV12230.1 HAMP domain-containing protein [Mesorhizobium sp. M8A.F.Ca.ET.173.01.1.1]TGV51326.1 HAMP domain-containing protein [bacterium M00.F.Ca.ET.141.01.1.1]TGV82541.1 HAMP domain-containin
MAVEAQRSRPAAAARRPSRIMPSFVSKFTVPMRRFLGHHIFSSLTRRILFLNLAGLAVLVTGILYLNTFRDGLIDARVESLMTQGEIIAGAIAASATVETDSISIDPEKLLELQAGESLGPGSDQLDNLDFPINPERVAPVLRRLISPTRTRARIYDRDANLLLDSRHLYSRGQILRYDLPPVEEEEPDLVERVQKFIFDFFRNTDLPVYHEQPGGNGAAFPEVVKALTGSPSTIVRVSEQGEQIVSVAVPIQRFRAVLGVLMLSTEGGDIDKIVAAERKAILRVFGIAALVTAILSMLLASTIANPLRRLSAAAVRVRRGVKSREEIPDFSDRQDEIGNLSIAVRDMTNALYARIEAIESFAADVSHELKNPLTSLRSAVETLPLAKNDTSRARLMEIIQHDVKRLDRLITDISDASRLDAELAREDAGTVDLKKFVTDLVAVSRETTRNKKAVEIELKVAKLPQGAKGYVVVGHDLRIGQVITNLIENARSFVPEDHGHISLSLARAGKFNILTVDDNGPGIRADTIDRIFERFYTDRPAGEAFGQNSGLGLSISRQIVEAHGGTLTAENIPGTKPGEIKGARFVVTLPAEG